jgi:ATP-dependent Lhr-like helicase
MRFSGLDSAGLTRRLWKMAWRGLVSADTFATLRQGLAGGFSADLGTTTTDAKRRARRGAFDRWRRQRPFAGAWFALPDQIRADDVLSVDEDSRERARIVLDRYGVVFRSLLQRELPELRWGSVFRALRLLELGGEVVAGHFIQDVPGLQCASHAAISLLREGPEGERVWWVNATDPASPCGLGLPFDDWPLPRRVSSNHLVFHGRELVVVSQRRGAELDIRVEADHPKLPDYFEFLRVQLTRTVQPRSRIDLEVINGRPATASPFRTGFENLFQVVRQPTCLRLMRMY